MERFSFADVQLRGRAGRTPDVRLTSTGVKITTVNLAISRGSKNETKTLWMPVKAFNSVAEDLEKVGRGDSVFIEGYLDISQWTDKQSGLLKERIECVAKKVEIRDKRMSVASNETQAPSNQIEDDLPF